MQVLRTRKPELSHEVNIVQWWLSVDPLAEKYPSWSPYNYVMGNPVRLIDPDGRSVEEWVNKNGDKVYDSETGKYTKYATAKDKKYGEMLRNSGEIGKRKFEHLVNSPTKIEVVFSDEVGYADEIPNMEAFGKTDKVVRGKNGEIESARITIYEGTSKKAMDRLNGLEEGNSFLSSNEEKYIKKGNLGADAITVGTFGHEISHTTKQNQDWKEADDYRAENYPDRIGEAIIKDLSEKEKR